MSHLQQFPGMLTLEAGIVVRKLANALVVLSSTAEDWEIEVRISVSKACTSLCMWVHAMYKYYFVNKSVAPKKATLATAKEELAITEKALAEAKARMKELTNLQKGVGLTDRKYIQVKSKDMLNNIPQMDFQIGLVSGLADEKERWKSTVASLGLTISNVIGDVLISAGAVAYLTPFTDKYRRGLLKEWLVIVGEVGVPHTVKCTPVATLGDPVTIRKWQLEGLPRDFLSTENAVLVFNSTRWPLFIDPQRQANRWIRNMGKASGLAISKLTDRDLLRSLESAVRFGKQCLIENVGTELDPALDSVLQKQVFRQAGTNVIKIGDSIVPYNEDFRLYITTKLPNPHYTPEVSIKVMVVNFALVPSGLQDQLLALVVMEERPDLEEARGALIVSSAQMRHELKEIEDRILYRLSVSEGSPVDDIDLINTLEASKVKSEEIKVLTSDLEQPKFPLTHLMAQQTTTRSYRPRSETHSNETTGLKDQV
uniref:Dynein heavy chain n=1 Tax=Timema genevievae TaxID=629358 RepID=A0A7R9K6B1_TIMGE|nr:unnamed protein product [Timema genevievae]